VVSNLFTGTGTGRMVVAADYAVPDSPDQLVVSVIVDPAGLLPSRAELRLPEGSFATILDRSHRVVARSRNHSRWQGADATPALVETLAADVEGVVFSRSLDNESTVVAWTRSDTTGWTTLVVVPRSEVLKPVWRNGVVFSLVAMGLLLLGVGLSRGFGRVLIGELKALEADAERLGHGAIIKPRTHRLENIGQVQAALSSASSELQARASRQMLMINELNHRVKNTLASVQAIAVQTFRRADPDAPAKFDQRLVALAGAHDLLTQTSWEPVEFHSVVARCAEAAAGNLTASGQALMLPPAAALALCMCLHELVTNSLKHGSLSTVGGKVVVTWSLTPEGEIDFLWREEGGPPVTPPDHSGFGTRLIDRLARTELGGEIVRDYAATGLILRGRFAPPTTERWSNRFD